jgi:large subunit ribosomal protein L37Ae
LLGAGGPRLRAPAAAALRSAPVCVWTMSEPVSLDARSYGASLRKQIKKQEVSQHAKYLCDFCGKHSVRRVATGIWNCKSCGKQKAGGAYTLNTPAAITCRSTTRRLRETVEK